MFNYARVTFPNTTASPQVVYNLSLYQNRYEHEVAVIQFRDWDVNYDVVNTGSPIVLNISSNLNSKTFYGYVHHVSVIRDTGTSITEVTAISASYVMKNQSQQVYKGLSADAIVQAIAKRNNFVAFTVPHPRIYPQVSQAGHSDWEMLIRLAKQSGYSLRTENTEIYFQPMLYEYTNSRSEAPVFVMRDANDPSGSSLYSFVPVVSESIEYDGESKGAIAISGLDANTVSSMSLTQQIRAKSTKSKVKNEFFDRFATEVVAGDAMVAKYEAEAAENRNMFPYRATAEVIGNAKLRPDMPVYIKGVGSYYAGYWTILGVEHKIVESYRNSQTYTTILHLGTDSLGTAVSWTDGNVITEPNFKPSRTIIPNVRQTAIVPSSKLNTTTPNLGPQNNGAFGVAVNRAKPQANGPIWVTTTQTLNPISQPSGSVALISTRTLKNVSSL